MVQGIDCWLVALFGVILILAVCTNFDGGGDLLLTRLTIL
jgi:hypothetical protein